MPRRWLFALLLLFLTFDAPVALAYLDPASGSMFLQLLLGGVAGFALIVKLFWHRFLSIFGLGRREEQAQPEAPEDDGTQY